MPTLSGMRRRGYTSTAIRNFVGTYARGPIPQGTLLNNQMFLAASEVVPDGAQEVGVVVDAGRRTTERPDPGDVVSLVFVSGSGGQPVGNLSPGDVVVCPEGRAGLHAFSNPTDEPAQILALSAGGFPDVVAYPEHGYAWVATRDPDPALLAEGGDPGIIARFEIPIE